MPAPGPGLIRKGDAMQVILKEPNGDERQIDTPDPALVGLWLKSIFDNLSYGSGPRQLPLRYILTVYK
jgi:hypothetical protein